MAPWAVGKIYRQSRYVIELPPGTIEQTGTQPLLECLDMLGRHRARQPELARCVGERAAVDDGDEGAKGDEAIHARPSLEVRRANS